MVSTLEVIPNKLNSFTQFFCQSQHLSFWWQISVNVFLFYTKNAFTKFDQLGRLKKEEKKTSIHVPISLSFFHNDSDVDIDSSWLLFGD